MTSLERDLVRRIVGAEGRAESLEEIEWSGPFRGANVIRTSAASIANITLVTLAFSTALYDRGDCWSAAASTRLYAPQSGYYIVGANIYWKNSGSAVGSRFLQIYRHDGVCCANTNVAGTSEAGIGQSLVTPPVWLAAGQYAVIKVYQSSGGPMLITTASPSAPYFCQASLVKAH